MLGVELLDQVVGPHDQHGEPVGGAGDLLGVEHRVRRLDARGNPSRARAARLERVGIVGGDHGVPNIREKSLSAARAVVVFVAPTGYLWIRLESPDPKHPRLAHIDSDGPATNQPIHLNYFFHPQTLAIHVMNVSLLELLVAQRTKRRLVWHFPNNK